MNCPGCGEPNQRYKEQKPRSIHGTKKHPRTKNSNLAQHSDLYKSKPRTNFKMKKCKKCGYEGDV